MAPRIDRPPPGCAFAPRCVHAEPRCAVERPPMLAVAEGRVSACFAQDRLGVPA
jgi:oligopeptide/dipeptide ABC transporter ATP-binding protein